MNAAAATTSTSDPIKLLTPRETRERLNVSHGTLYKLLSQNAFQTVKIGKSRRFVASSVDEYIRRRIVGGEAS